MYSYQNENIIFTRRGIDIDKYPAIEDHLIHFKEDLTPKTDSIQIGRKPGNYKWFEIQVNRAYFEEFLKEKIIWLEISDKANFCFDSKKSFITNSAYFISGKNLKYLLGVLNSKVFDFYLFQISPKIAGGRKRYTKQYVEQVPIPLASNEEMKVIAERVDQIIIKKENNLKVNTSILENEIDQLVYQLYRLSENEIEIVEDYFKD